MTKSKKTAIGAVAVIVVLGILLYSMFASNYNRFVQMEVSIETAWAQVENQLQRRYDLIPNLVETVRGYAGHERELLVEVTEARSRVGGAETVPDAIDANNQLSAALSRLLLVVERYPDLKANQSFIRLQDELAGTENRIAVERMRYNESVRTYNRTIRSFPALFLAALYGFEEASYYEVPSEARQAPEVSF